MVMEKLDAMRIAQSYGEQIKGRAKEAKRLVDEMRRAIGQKYTKARSPTDTTRSYYAFMANKVSIGDYLSPAGMLSDVDALVESSFSSFLDKMCEDKFRNMEPEDIIRGLRGIDPDAVTLGVASIVYNHTSGLVFDPDIQNWGNRKILEQNGIRVKAIISPEKPLQGIEGAVGRVFGGSVDAYIAAYIKQHYGRGHVQSSNGA